MQNYYNGFYNPYMQLPVQQPQPQQPQQQNHSISVVFAPTVADVEKVEMLPNDIKIVLVQNQPDLMAIRVANAMGFTQTEYRSTKVIDPAQLQNTGNQQQGEIETLKQEMQELKKAIGGLGNVTNERKQSTTK